MQTHLEFDLAATGAYSGPLNVAGLLPDWAAARHAAEVLTGPISVDEMTAAQIVAYDLSA